MARAIKPDARRVREMTAPRRERLDTLRRVLKLPHTVEQLAERLGVHPSTVAEDLAILREWIVANNDEDPPTYRLANKRDYHEPDIEIRCTCGATWRGLIVYTTAAKNIAAHAKRGGACRLLPPTPRTDAKYRAAHERCQSSAHYAVRGDGLEGP